MATTAQNHMEPLHDDGKKREEYEYEDERTCSLETEEGTVKFAVCDLSPLLRAVAAFSVRVRGRERVSNFAIRSSWPAHSRILAVLRYREGIGPSGNSRV